MNFRFTGFWGFGVIMLTYLYYLTLKYLSLYQTNNFTMPMQLFIMGTVVMRRPNGG